MVTFCIGLGFSVVALVAPSAPPAAAPSAAAQAAVPSAPDGVSNLAQASGLEVAAEIEPAADEPEVGELFVNGNNAYEAGDFAGAIALYEALIERGVHNGYVDYNLGNALLRNGELGRAIASYRRSLVLLPREQDARANLEFARKSRRDDLQPPVPEPILGTLFFWHYTFSRAELMRTAVVTNFLLWGVLALLLYRRRSEALRWIAVGLAVILTATAGSLLVRAIKPARVAVVIPQEIDVLSGTGVETVVRFKLHAGTEVRTTASREGWIQVELPDGQRGWIESEHAELVVD